MNGYPIDPAVSAIAILALCALAVVLISRLNRTVALLGALGSYACAFLIIGAFGVRAVATAWVAMAAATSLIYAIVGTSVGGASAGATPRPPLVPSMIASFVVGLFGWPFVFPGIRTTDSDATNAPSPPEIAASSAEDVDEDVDHDVDENENRDGAMLAGRPGVASVSISGGYVLVRATQSAPAELRAPLGVAGSWPEDRTASFSIQIPAGVGGTIVALGKRSEVLSRVTIRDNETFDRDRSYEIAAAFGRAYEGGMRVDDSLEGLSL